MCYLLLLHLKLSIYLNSQQSYMSLSFLYICYNLTFDDYKYCCVEVHDQLVPCEIIVISLKYVLCFMILCNLITLNHNQQHQLSEVTFKTLHDLLS